MLPKPEKNRKSTSEQLRLDQGPTPEEKLKHKRRTVIIFLSLTAGLSLIFILYRLVSHFTFPHALPQLDFNFTSSTKNPVDPIVSRYSTSNIWSYYVSIGTTIYSRNEDQLFTVSSLDQLQKNLDSRPLGGNLSSALPEGTSFKELAQSNPNSQLQAIKISLPSSQEIVIILKISGSDISTAVAAFPQIVKEIYWALVNSL